jgi:hypothetical protein
MKAPRHNLRLLAAIAALALTGRAGLASSHMDAPLITRDPSANTTDVYAFVDQEGSNKNLVVALGVYPHEEPGVGPNKYNFDDNVLYEIHVALGSDVASGRATLSYQWNFTTAYKTEGTILQSYLGVVQHVDDAAQNLTQHYTVTKVDHRLKGKKAVSVLGTGVVPPNNEGVATPFYNQGDDGTMPAKGGVTNETILDRYTLEAITHLSGGYVAFAGQRDDGFYADVGAIFDLLKLRSPGKDSQGGFNIHLVALKIPVSELGGDQQVVGVYATTSRQAKSILSAKPEKKGDKLGGKWVQVARQGNPLFNEALVALADKDLYSRTTPEQDSTLFAKYALQPELCKLINLLVIPGSGLNPAVESNRTDIAGIFIPDVIKVDLSTGPARLTNTGGDDETTGFKRLSVFGGDALHSTVQAGLPGFPAGTIPGGWPNGRRFGDDVVDIAITALISDLRSNPLIIQGPVGDGVDSNDTTYSTVFPYESTPQNGRVHSHP